MIVLIQRGRSMLMGIARPSAQPLTNELSLKSPRVKNALTCSRTGLWLLAWRSMC
jgi:hypothetical protein